MFVNFGYFFTLLSLSRLSCLLFLLRLKPPFDIMRNEKITICVTLRDFHQVLCVPTLKRAKGSRKVAQQRTSHGTDDLKVNSCNGKYHKRLEQLIRICVPGLLQTMMSEKTIKASCTQAISPINASSPKQKSFSDLNPRDPPRNHFMARSEPKLLSQR